MVEPGEFVGQTALVIGTQGGKYDRIIRASGRSVIARQIAKEARDVALADREPLIEAMLRAAGRHQITREFAAGQLSGWRLAPGAIRLVAGEGSPRPGQRNSSGQGR